MKTWKELRLTGKPFIVGFTIYIPLPDNDTVLSYRSKEDFYIQKVSDGTWYDGYIKLHFTGDIIDWFEDNISPDEKHCTCDFVSVLLVSGCKCGGK